jgi:hypothetical protein
LITACYQPVLPAGAPCSTTNDCPGNQICSLGACAFSSAAVPDAAASDATQSAADRDRDGIADVQDNCPDLANPDQANEDADKFGDACDSCPQLADNAPKDSDGDGLADACDPNPTGTIHDSMWLFAGFRAGVPSGWATTNSWAPAGDGDTVRVTAAGTGTSDEYATLPLSATGRNSFDNFTLTAAFTIEATVGTQGPELGFGIGDATVNNELDCTLYQNGGNANDHNLGLYDRAGNNSVAFQWQTGVPYTLTAVRKGTTYTCTVTGPNGPLTTTKTSQVVPNGASVVFWAYGVTARIDWVFVAGTP